MLTTWPLKVVPDFSGCHPFFTISLYLLMMKGAVRNMGFSFLELED
jgi:hypothetical protein